MSIEKWWFLGGVFVASSVLAAFVWHQWMSDVQELNAIDRKLDELVRKAKIARERWMQTEEDNRRLRAELAERNERREQ